MKASLKAVKTGDGSMTLYSDRFDATYHSHHGALNESRHVFIQNGLAYMRSLKSVRVLELGFGTGLNAALCLHYLKDYSQQITYHTLEKYPVDMESFQTLNFLDLLDRSTYEALLQMHKLAWNECTILENQFEFKKIETDFAEFKSAEKYNIVFHDAFAPNTQSEFWDIPFLEKIYNLMAEGAILVTFCAKGSFKRALKAVGFDVEALEGPPGKREMTRAHKK